MLSVAWPALGPGSCLVACHTGGGSERSTTCWQVSCRWRSNATAHAWRCYSCLPFPHRTGQPTRPPTPFRSLDGQGPGQHQRQLQPLNDALPQHLHLSRSGSAIETASNKPPSHRVHGNARFHLHARSPVAACHTPPSGCHTPSIASLTPQPLPHSPCTQSGAAAWPAAAH